MGAGHDGLTRLSEQAARRLSGHSGHLSLRGLRVLSGTVAESLCRHEGFIDIRSVSSISDAAAASLGKHSSGINLTGVGHLSDHAAEALCHLRFTTTDAVGTFLRVSDAVARQLKNARSRLRRHL
jgi:hypothetical protein